MQSLVIFKVGDTFGHLAARMGDFEHWITHALGDHPFPVSVIDPRKGEALPEYAHVAGAIVTGSHSMVTERAPWSEALATWLRGAVEATLPILGICYGHQLLADALGGEVEYHPGGIELGRVHIYLDPAAGNDPLFRHLPAQFPAHVVHRQHVCRLPPGAIRLASNDFEPHHAFRAGATAWGIQFHPEFNAEAMATYVDEITRCEPGSTPAIRGAETPESSALLAGFAQVVRQCAEGKKP